MAGVPLIALEGLLGLVPLVWGIWELMSLKRDRKRDAAKREAAKRDEATRAGGAADPLPDP